MSHARRAGCAATVLALALALVIQPSSTAAQPPTPGSWNSLHTAFVTRDGTALTAGGEPFRFAGTNIYWLGLDENVGGIAYPTYFRIRDALDTAKAMGFTVVRSHMLASTGHELSILPSKADGYQDAAFATIDYAIAYAGSIGIRLILPLTDEWSYYHGGHRDFTDPYGLDSAAFYSDPRVIADYQDYVRHIMHRTNALTGVAYRDDPTILAWELGNELNGMTRDWIDANAEAFHEWAPRQLIAAGRQFSIDPDTLAAPGVDIVDVHYYPPTVEDVQSDAAAVTAAGKVYVAGEYASTSARTELLAPLAADPNVTGMLSWSLFGHHDRSGFVAHDDGFTMHYPGDDARMVTSVDAQMEFARAMSPAGRFQVGAPLVTEVSKRAGLNVVRWRGSAGATGYQVERSWRGRYGPWRPAQDGLVTDHQTPWTDLVGTGDVWYRVVPVDRYGHRGTPSHPVDAGAAQTVLIDPALDVATGHTGVAVTPTRDGEVVGPDGSAPAAVSWTVPGARLARFDVVAPRTGPHDLGLAVEAAADGASWEPVETAVRRESTGRYAVTASFRAPADQVRLSWLDDAAGLVRAGIWAADPAPVEAAPGAFTLASPAPGAVDVVGPRAFAWTEADRAGYYTLTVSPHPDLSDPVIQETGLVDTTYPPAAELAPSTTYHWRVAATNALGSTSTEVASFTTRALPTEPATIDDFESFADSAAIAAAYQPNPNGDPITVTLAPSGTGQAMQLDYNLSAAGYAGVTRTFESPLDVWGQEGIELWLDPSGTGANLTIQFVTAGVYFEYTLPGAPSTGVVRIPFSDFDHPGWAWSGPLDLQRFEQLSFYAGGSGQGRLIVDNVLAYPGGGAG